MAAGKMHQLLCVTLLCIGTVFEGRGKALGRLAHQISAEAPLAVGRSDFTATPVAEDSVILVGGCSGTYGERHWSCVEVLDFALEFTPSLGTFTSLPIAPRPRYRHSAAVANNKLYVMGGLNAGDEAIVEIDVLDLETHQWSTLTDQLPSALSDGYAFEFDGNVHFGGGYLSDDNYLGNQLMYKISSNGSLTPDGVPPPKTRGDGSAIKMGGLVYLIGGFDPNNDFRKIKEMHVFNGRVWKSIWAPRFALGDSAVAAYRGRIYVIGGEKSYQSKSNRIQVFDLTNRKWLNGGTFDFPSLRSASFAAQGKLFVVGGQTWQSYERIAEPNVTTLVAKSRKCSQAKNRVRRRRCRRNRN